jgi:hypothetical protein
MPRVVASSQVVIGIKSEPPSGMKKVKNIWWDVVKGEFVIDVED